MCFNVKDEWMNSVRVFPFCLFLVPPEQSGSTGYMACGNGFYPSSQTNSPRGKSLSPLKLIHCFPMMMEHTTCMNIHFCFVLCSLEQFESNGNMPCGNRFYTNGPTNSPRGKWICVVSLETVIHCPPTTVGQITAIDIFLCLFLG